jgi:hypothetical protein
MRIRNGKSTQNRIFQDYLSPVLIRFEQGLSICVGTKHGCYSTKAMRGWHSSCVSGSDVSVFLPLLLSAPLLSTALVRRLHLKVVSLATIVFIAGERCLGVRVDSLRQKFLNIM